MCSGLPRRYRAARMSAPQPSRQAGTRHTGECTRRDLPIRCIFLRCMNTRATYSRLGRILALLLAVLVALATGGSALATTAGAAGCCIAETPCHSGPADACDDHCDCGVETPECGQHQADRGPVGKAQRPGDSRPAHHNGNAAADGCTGVCACCFVALAAPCGASTGTMQGTHDSYPAPLASRLQTGAQTIPDHPPC